MRKALLAASSILFLAGCVGHEPLISEINDSSMKIEANIDVPQAEIDALAIEGCAAYGKKPSQPLSERRIDNKLFTREIWYACQ